jgi:hypothetical protein
VTDRAKPVNDAADNGCLLHRGYFAFSVPALDAGVATTKFGLHSTALFYSASLAVLAAAAVGILLLRRLGGGLPSLCLQLGDLLAGRGDKLVIGVRVTP